MTLRVGLEIASSRARFLLPREFDERPIRIGKKADVDVDLPVDVLVFRKNGRILVASASSKAPVTLGGAPLPTWFVPLPIPCTLAAGGVEFRLFCAVVRTPPHGIRLASVSERMAIPAVKIEDTVVDNHDNEPTPPHGPFPSGTLGPLAGARGALDAAAAALPPRRPSPQAQQAQPLFAFDVPVESTRRFHIVSAPPPRSFAPARHVTHALRVLHDGVIAFGAEWKASTRETKLAFGAMIVASVALLLLAR
jgi:hypothetical protein